MKPFTHSGEFNHALILEEIERTPIWNWLNIRKFVRESKHVASEDIILRWQNLQGTVEEQFLSNECYNLVTAHLFPRVMSSIAHWAPGNVGRIVIAKLPAGAAVEPHCDQGPYADAHDRYHWVVKSNPDCILDCQGHKMHLVEGSITLINNHELHAAYNTSLLDRIHIIVDIAKDL